MNHLKIEAGLPFLVMEKADWRTGQR